MKPGHWVFKVPDALSDALVSPINCALSEVIYGLNQIGITLGDTVVIQGAGGLGLYATAVAKEMGAGENHRFRSAPCTSRTRAGVRCR